METIAVVGNDVDLRVVVREKNLLRPEQYREILLNAGRGDAAFEWAELGVGRFQQWPDFRLTRFLVREYGRRERSREALDAAWKLYATAPGVEAYLLLKEQATYHGTWEMWRPKAIALVEERRARSGGDVSLQVEILLADGDDDAAWEVATTEEGCRNEVWLQLAAARAGHHPDDALTILSGADRGRSEAGQSEGLRADREPAETDGADPRSRRSLG